MIKKYKYPYWKRFYWNLKKLEVQQTLDTLLDSQYWSPEIINDLRNRKFRILMEHCYKYVPYYNKLLSEMKLMPNDFRTIDDLNLLPVLTKDIVRKNFSYLKAVNIPKSQLVVSKTGGTTGEPIHINRWIYNSPWQTQCYVRGLMWGGLMPSDRRVKLFGGSLGQREKTTFKSIASSILDNKTLFLPAFELNKENVNVYLHKIKSRSCKHLIGYASAALILARLVEKSGEKLNLSTVFTTAEMIPDHWKQKIADVFSCKVYSYYGCGEVHSLAFQITDGNEYVCSDEHAIIEVKDRSGEIALDGQGEFILTDLDNYAFPLLRYQNGDAGVIQRGPYSNKIGLSCIKRLDGRVNDFLIDADGKYISGVIATHTFRLVQGVDQYQFIQDEPGKILIKIVKNEDYDKTINERTICEIFDTHFSKSIELEFDYTDRIDKSISGKARFVINNYLKQLI